MEDTLSDYNRIDQGANDAGAARDRNRTYGKSPKVRMLPRRQRPIKGSELKIGEVDKTDPALWQGQTPSPLGDQRTHLTITRASVKREDGDSGAQ